MENGMMRLWLRATVVIRLPSLALRVNDETVGSGVQQQSTKPQTPGTLVWVCNIYKPKKLTTQKHVRSVPWYSYTVIYLKTLANYEGVYVRP